MRSRTDSGALACRIKPHEQGALRALHAPVLPPQTTIHKTRPAGDISPSPTRRTSIAPEGYAAVGFSECWATAKRPPHRSLALAGTLVCVAVGVVVLGRFRRSLRGAFLALCRPDRSDPGPLPRFLSARPALQVETFQPSPKKTGEGTGVPLLNLLESCRGPIYYHRPAPERTGTSTGTCIVCGHCAPIHARHTIHSADIHFIMSAVSVCKSMAGKMRVRR